MMVSLALQKVKSGEGKWEERESWRGADVYGEGVVTLPTSLKYFQWSSGHDSLVLDIIFDDVLA